MSVFFKIPGYGRLVQFWQAYSSEECKHFPIISNGPHLPIVAVFALYLLTKIVIPSRIKKRGFAYDTRPLGLFFLISIP